MDLSPKEILVLKLSSLGDIVHTLPAMAALRRRFDSAHICWLVKSEWSSILDGNPDINEVWSVDVSWRNWPKLVTELRRRPWDLVIDFQGLFRTGLLGLLSGAQVRVGFARAREGAPWMYSHRVSLPGDQNLPWRMIGVHAVDRNLAIANFLGADISKPILHFPELGEDQSYIQHVLDRAHVQSHERLIALAPWSRAALKSWPIDRFLQLAEELLQWKGIRVVVVGGSADSHPAEQFDQLRPRGLVNVVGKISLRQLPELLRRMKLVVGNDSSLIHIAAGVGTRVVAIYGPTEVRATGPYPVRQHVVHRTELACSPCGQQTCRNPHYQECLQTISVEALLRSIHETMTISHCSS